MGAWITFVKEVSEIYGIDPNFALGVAQVESGLPGICDLRFGKLGRSKYYGAFGIHRCFLKRWDIKNPYINAWRGIAAIAYWRTKEGSLKAAMRKYNTSFNAAYWKAIKNCERQNKKRGVFCGKSKR